MRPNQTAPREPARKVGSPGVRSSGIIGPLESTVAATTTRARGQAGASGDRLRWRSGPWTRDANSQRRRRRRRVDRGVTMPPIEATRQDVERRMLRGEHFTDVEDAINSSDVSADAKAALWLLAWSYVHPRAQRREASAHLAALTAAIPPRTISSRRRLRIVR
jgi:hypothetical protein